VDLLGRYSNPDIVSRLNGILSGQGRDRVSRRPVPSLRQKQTRLAEEQVSELIAMHEQGAPIDELAATFGIHRTTVMTHLDRAGTERRTGVIQRHLNEARSLYESGSSLAHVAEHYDVDAETVRRAFTNAVISLRPRRGWQY
jgi:DNA invertase Pin-like site-specific DNA recombinase